ncbi:MAG TPA: leucine/isoleucine/valine-binding protein [Verrucomicrobia bacterium]|nr:MAG: leucine/isoleucine/valine-binding protein [Lentisphaerae bacterium GWF2_57_35]HBA83309.1 leucine/isoleucine/valine-binding protein [Verrucomicrobiota bacterium]
MHRILTSYLVLLFILVSQSLPVNNVMAEGLVLGQSTALTGPAKALGLGMKSGLDACFARHNEECKEPSCKITLISKDDGYEPERAIVSTKELIEQDKVLLLIGEVGTPTSKAVLPLVNEAKIPFVAPFTGAELLRSPFNPYIINIRASYYQEMERLAALIVDKKQLKKVACFYQNDSFGQAGFEGIKIALAKRNLELIGVGTFERNTLAVKKGLLDIRAAAPEAVVMVGTYEPCAEFIKLAKKAGMKEALFCNISFVGTDALCQALGTEGEGCVISQVVPFPHDESIPLVKEYIEALKKNQPDATPGFVSLEGYMAGKFFCSVAKQLKDGFSREDFIKAVETIKTFDLGGVTLTFGEQDHQGMDQVYLTVIKDGKVAPLKED